MKRLLLLSAVLALCLAPLLEAQAKDKKPTLPPLRRKLLEAHGDEAIKRALHEITKHIGTKGFPADHGKFADWLQTIPDGRADHPIVRRHQGWALVMAKRGGEAVGHLEAGLKNDPSDGLTRAWLADALRQGGRYDEATAMLVKAVQCGQEGKYVRDTMHSIIFNQRKEKISGHADDLPEYVLLARQFLAVLPDASIHHSVARLLLSDFIVYEKPDRTRGKSWALAASIHAHKGITLAEKLVGGELVLALDAAVALEFVDQEMKGATLRYDLLAIAYRLGADPLGGANKNPRVVTWLAEAAARDQRYELAHRLAQERLEISDSPRVRRLLRSLPPDITGEDEGD